MARSLGRTPHRPVRRWLLVAAALVALAGLFAMHGLSDHGTSGSAVAAAHGVSTGHGAGHVSGHADGPAPSEPSHHHDAGAAGLCLAVLAAALVLALGLVLALALRPALGRVVRPPRRWGGLTWVVRARPAWPPDLLALSVQRC